MSKVLILYTSVGKGHQTIAENIGASLESAGFTVKLADIGRVQSGRFSKMVIGTHQFINKYLPFVWGFLYRYGHYPVLPLRTFIARFNSAAARKLVEDFQPDLVITTQTAASAVVAFLKQQGSYKIYSGLPLAIIICIRTGFINRRIFIWQTSRSKNPP